MEEKLKELLDEYYGDCRNDDHKQEIIDFIVSNYYRIVTIYKQSNNELEYPLCVP